MNFIRIAMITLMFVSATSHAGGVALGATRVIYDGSKKETSLTVKNKSAKEEFLIQSWIDDASGSKKTPFIITPPLFKLDPAKNGVLRIVNIDGSALPKDRESLFWVNVKSIPARSEENASSNVLQIAVRTRLKLLYRPEGLKGDVNSAAKALKFSNAGNQLHIENATPFNITFNKFSINGKAIDKVSVVPPKGSVNLPFPAGISSANEVNYTIINDFGTSGEKFTAKVN